MKKKNDKLNFHEIAEIKGYDDTNYPYSTKGLRMMKNVIFNVKCLLIVLVIHIFQSIARWWFKLPSAHLKDNLEVSSQPVIDSSFNINFEALSQSFSFSNIMFLLKNLGTAILDILEAIYHIIETFNITVITVCMLIWFYYAMKRNMNYERNVFKNDITATNLKLDIVKSLELNRKSKTLSQKIRKANESKDSDTYSLEVDKSAIDIMRRMNVFVNTRQSLEDDSVITLYRIEMSPPIGQDEYEKLMSYLQRLSDVADNQMKGKVSFGDISLSKDRSMISCKAKISEKDKYDYSDWVVEDTSDNSVYEYTYHLSHLKDNREIIKKLEHKAVVWANRTGDTLDNVLTTAKAKVDRLSTYVSASTVLYTYAITFKIDAQNFEKFQDSLDVTFGTKGITAQIKNGNLQISIPLPKELLIPIDVGSMYREVFGSDGE